MALAYSVSPPQNGRNLHVTRRNDKNPQVTRPLLDKILEHSRNPHVAREECEIISLLGFECGLLAHGRSLVAHGRNPGV